MFRKIALALAAATVVATAAVPTAASAYWDGYRYHRPGVSVTYGSGYSSYGWHRGYRHHYRCNWVKRWVHTRYGWKRIWVRKCHH